MTDNEKLTAGVFEKLDDLRLKLHSLTDYWPELPITSVLDFFMTVAYFIAQYLKDVICYM